MREIEEFINLIFHGEINKASVYLKRIYNNTPDQQYADALFAVIVLKACEILEEKVQGFYIDKNELNKRLFSENAFQYTDKIIERLSQGLRESLKENKGRMLKKALDFIKGRVFDQSFYTEEIATFLGISSPQLTKLFKEHLGTTPKDYVSTLRVEKSIPFILDATKKIGDVAMMSGFTSAESYIRAFKKLYGITPGKYMREKE